MKRLLALLLLTAPAFALPPGKGGVLKVKPQPPSHLRLVYPDGRGLTYGSGVPFKDGVITVAHAGVKPGQVVRSEGIERTVAAVIPITVPTVSAGTGLENQSGDVVFLTLDSPFPAAVRRATLGTVAAGKVTVTHKAGNTSPRTVANKAVLARTAAHYPKDKVPPDYVNPRWLILTGTALPLVGGDSGGAILDAKGRLISIVSRIGAGQGPNLVHKDVRKLLP